MPRRARTPTVASLIVLHFALAGCQPASFDGILAVSTNVREGSTTATPYLRVDWKKGTGVSAFEIAAAAGRDPDPVADAFASVGPAAYTLEMEPREVWTRHGQNPPADYLDQEIRIRVRAKAGSGYIASGVHAIRPSQVGPCGCDMNAQVTVSGESRQLVRECRFTEQEGHRACVVEIRAPLLHPGGVQGIEAGVIGHLYYDPAAAGSQEVIAIHGMSPEAPRTMHYASIALAQAGYCVMAPGLVEPPHPTTADFVAYEVGRLTTVLNFFLFVDGLPASHPAMAAGIPCAFGGQIGILGGSLGGITATLAATASPGPLDRYPQVTMPAALGTVQPRVQALAIFNPGIAGGASFADFDVADGSLARPAVIAYNFKDPAETAGHVTQTLWTRISAPANTSRYLIEMRSGLKNVGANLHTCGADLVYFPESYLCEDGGSGVPPGIPDVLQTHEMVRRIGRDLFDEWLKGIPPSAQSPLRAPYYVPGFGPPTQHDAEGREYDAQGRPVPAAVVQTP